MDGLIVVFLQKYYILMWSYVFVSALKETGSEKPMSVGRLHLWVKTYKGKKKKNKPWIPSLVSFIWQKIDGFSFKVLILQKC